MYFCIFAISLLSPLEKGRALHSFKLESHSLKDALYQVWLILPTSGSGILKNCILSMYFHYFVIISSWKRMGPFNWTNLNSRRQRMLCSKFGWISSGEEEFTTTTTTMTTTNNGQKLRLAFSSSELKMKSDWYMIYC